MAQFHIYIPVLILFPHTTEELTIAGIVHAAHDHGCLSELLVLIRNGRFDGSPGARPPDGVKGTGVLQAGQVAGVLAEKPEILVLPSGRSRPGPVTTLPAQGYTS
jgi:hypothetical protein